MQKSRTKRKVVARRIKPKAKVRQRKAASVQRPYHHMSHTGALISEIIEGADDAYTTPEALEFALLLSNLTTTLQDITYSSGINAGRLVHSMSAHGRPHEWQEDSMPYLVSFIEKAGHPKVTYHVFPGDFWLRFSDKGMPDIGANLHTFEAGIIAGFISASRKHAVSATEAVCSMSGHVECMFTSQVGERKPAGKESIERFVTHVSRLASAGKRQKPDVPLGYYMLASGILYDPTYLDAIKQVVAHIGAQIAQKTIISKRKGVDVAISTIPLLGLGQPRLKKLSPLELEVRFTGRHTRREHTELSVAFISGLLNNLVAKNRTLEAATSHSKGNYTIKIREVRSQLGKE
ncbi:MAG TPA: hypothetical protein VND15_03035 [Candidatus Acidoferrales bacterium]|nr:hypothetical protein [Candidatus Acidoferrales bacterium]